MKTQFNLKGLIMEDEDIAAVGYDINNYTLNHNDGKVDNYDANIVDSFIIADNQSPKDLQKVQAKQEFSSYPTIKTAPWFNMVLKSVSIPDKKYCTQRRLLLLVIVKGDGRLEFTTHKYYGEDGSIYSGNYHSLLDEAIIDFNTRCNEKGI